MGKLYDKMLMAMELRNFSERTIKSYTSYMRDFVLHFGKSPEELGETEIKEYLYYLKKDKLASYSQMNCARSAIKFFNEQVLERTWEKFKLPSSLAEKKLPVVLSRKEVQAIFEATDNFKHRLILRIIYSAGLRISESLHLKVCNIDSQRMQIRVEQGKGKKDRYVVLSKKVLPELRDYYRVCRPHDWLFPGKDGKSNPLSVSAIQKAFKRAKKKLESKACHSTYPAPQLCHPYIRRRY